MMRIPWKTHPSWSAEENNQQQATSSSFHKDIHILFEDEEDDKEDNAYNDNKDEEVQVLNLMFKNTARD
jgi:hypothetical protein